jgi:hypothetical protein
MGGTALILCLLTAACGGTYTYYSSAAARAYFRIPSAWTKFTRSDLFGGTGQPTSASPTEKAVRFIMGFDANPKASVDHIIHLTPARPTAYPIVFTVIRSVSASDADNFSMKTIRNSIFPIDELLSNPQAGLAPPVSLIAVTNITTPAGFYGSRITYDLTYDPGQGFTSVGSVVLRYTQLAVFDPHTSLFYLFLIGCGESCYSHSQAVIDQVLSSWKVKGP